MTLAQLIRRVEQRLRSARLHYGHGTRNPREEAAFLVIRGLRLPFDADRALPVDPERIENLVRRRIRERAPAAYLLGEAWLSGLRFHVDRRVIVPRSHIADMLAEGLEPWRPKPLRRILDLCTGSGCLAVLAARAFPRARLWASDLSPDALAVARKNLELHRVHKRVRLLRSDLFRSLGRRRFDLIVTNPPYVTGAAMARLPPEYRHEPRLALAGGGGGLDLVRRIMADAPDHLAPHGLLVCEVGDGRRAVERVFPRLPLIWPKDEVFIVDRASIAALARTPTIAPESRR